MCIAHFQKEKGKGEMNSNGRGIWLNVSLKCYKGWIAKGDIPHL